MLNSEHREVMEVLVGSDRRRSDRAVAEVVGVVGEGTKAGESRVNACIGGSLLLPCR